MAPPPTPPLPEPFGRTDVGLLAGLVAAPLVLLWPVLAGPPPSLGGSVALDLGARPLAVTVGLLGVALFFLGLRRLGVRRWSSALIVALYALHPLRIGPFLGADGGFAPLAALLAALALALASVRRLRPTAWLAGLAALTTAAWSGLWTQAGASALATRLAAVPQRVGALAGHELVGAGAEPFLPGVTAPGGMAGPTGLGNAIAVGLVALCALGALRSARRRVIALAAAAFVLFAALMALAPSQAALSGSWSTPAAMGLLFALVEGFRAVLRGPRAGLAATLVGTAAVLGVARNTWHERAAWHTPATLAQFALERDAGCWPAERLLARNDFAHGRLSSAARRAEHVLALRPGDGPALALRGEVELRRGLIPGHEAHLLAALTWLEPASKAEARDPRALELLGEVHQRLGRLEPATRALEEAQRAQPDRALFAARLGMLHLEGGQLGAALESFERGTRAQPDEPDCWCGLGIVRYQRGEPAEARAALERALAIEPDHVESRALLGRLDEDSGDDTGAEQAYRRAIGVNPDYADGLYALGALCLRQGRLQAARPPLERLTAQRPAHVRAQVALARVYLGTGEPERARAALDLVLARNPGHVEARALRSDLEGPDGR